MIANGGLEIAQSYKHNIVYPPKNIIYDIILMAQLIRFKNYDMSTLNHYAVQYLGTNNFDSFDGWVYVRQRRRRTRLLGIAVIEKIDSDIVNIMLLLSTKRYRKQFLSKIENILFKRNETVLMEIVYNRYDSMDEAIMRINQYIDCGYRIYTIKDDRIFLAKYKQKSVVGEKGGLMV